MLLDWFLKRFNPLGNTGMRDAYLMISDGYAKGGVIFESQITERSA